MRTVWTGGGALLWVLAAIAGCGDPQAGELIPEAPKAETHPVKGKVLLGDGKPLTEGTVSFIPLKQPARGASGTIQGDGTFELETAGVGPGAAEGDYSVSIQSPLTVPAAKGATKPAVPSLYTVDDNTPLRATVKAGSNDLKPFQLREKPGGKAVPKDPDAR